MPVTLNSSLPLVKSPSPPPKQISHLLSATVVRRHYPEPRYMGSYSMHSLVWYKRVLDGWLLSLTIIISRFTHTIVYTDSSF